MVRFAGAGSKSDDIRLSSLCRSRVLDVAKLVRVSAGKSPPAPPFWLDRLDELDGDGRSGASRLLENAVRAGMVTDFTEKTAVF
jgi:hypothetical protein